MELERGSHEGKRDQRQVAEEVVDLEGEVWVECELRAEEEEGQGRRVLQRAAEAAAGLEERGGEDEVQVEREV